MPSEHRLHPLSMLFALSGSLKAFALPAILLVFSGLRGSSRRSAPEPPADPGLVFEHAYANPPPSFSDDLAELRRILGG